MYDHNRKQVGIARETLPTLPQKKSFQLGNFQLEIASRWRFSITPLNHNAALRCLVSGIAHFYFLGFAVAI